MRIRFTHVVFAIFVLLTSSSRLAAQLVPCPPNIDWENGDTTGWEAHWGGYNPPADGVSMGPAAPPPPAVPQTIINTPRPYFTPRRQEIMNTSLPNDPYGGFPVVDPLGGSYSVRLGSDTDGSDFYRASRVQYAFTVAPGNDAYAINFLYAVVLNDGGHNPEEQPRFTVSVIDAATGQSVKDGCYDLNFVADVNLPGFIVSPQRADVLYKPWTKHTLSLRGLAGKNLILDIVVGGCSASGHWGYGYFDVLDCGEFKAVLDSCNLDRAGAYLHGPDGYMTYEWWNQDYTVLADTGRYVAFQPTSLNAEMYNLILTPYPSVSLCKDTIKTPHLANIKMDKPDTTCLLPNTAILLNANIEGGAGSLNYEWTEYNPGSSLSCNNCPSPVANTATSNYYVVKARDTSGCARSEIISVGVNENTLDVTDDFVLCHPGYTTLNVEPDGPLPLTPVGCGTLNATPCAATTMIEMQTLYRQPLSGKGDTTTLNNPFAAQYSSAHMQFLLRKDDMYAYGTRYGTLNSIGFEVVNAGGATFDSFSISLTCTDRTSIAGGFEGGTTLVYKAPAAVVPAGGWNDFTFDQPYNFDTSQNLVVDICFSNPVTNIPATVIALNTGSMDMISAYTTTPGASICQGALPQGTTVQWGRPNTRIGFCKSQTKPFEYTWTPGLYLSDSTAKTPLAYIPETVEYHVVSIGGSDCKIEDSVTITVPIHDYEIFPKDTSVCLGQPFMLTAAGTFSSVKWFEYDPLANTFNTPTTLNCAGCPNPNNIANPIATPTDTTTYAVEYTDKDGCNDTLYMNVIVRPLPPVNIINNDTTIKYGQDIMLLVSGAYLYTWSPTGSLSNPNVVNPVASPNDPTLYYVYGIGENGCRNIDSVMVNIDYRANLFVPTAFTPNGDGKNDIFKVSNITFQRLQEFRVFNRWGQEIFSTNDIKSGWDGSWKGQPQDMGVYQYVIRVAYPDGIIETYKGNITLVR